MQILRLSTSISRATYLNLMEVTPSKRGPRMMMVLGSVRRLRLNLGAQERVPDGGMT